MASVVTPFLRKRHANQPRTVDPRHRRDGYFDEQDQWHDAEESAASPSHGIVTERF